MQAFGSTKVCFFPWTRILDVGGGTSGGWSYDKRMQFYPSQTNSCLLGNLNHFSVSMLVGCLLLISMVSHIYTSSQVCSIFFTCAPILNQQKALCFEQKIFSSSL